MKKIKILGIDTSCDDTCISLLKSKIQNPKSKIKGVNFEIFSNIISSQVKLHAKYGGVYPSLAKREHQKNLPLVFRRATKGIKLSEVNLIAVTVGPGLEPCLWQGINFAKDLAGKIKKPIIPINHIEAHIVANFLGENSKFNLPAGGQNSKLFPAICLVVSGGHTQLILIRGIGKYKLIGETRDDAAGECFDKTARILGLSYPGGPMVAKIAAKFKNQSDNKRISPKIKLPRPMMYTKDYDFSFSGLKTAVLYEVKKFKKLNFKLKAEFCAEIQQAIIDVLVHKTIKAAKDFKAKSIILGGGVAANDELRKQFKVQSSKFKVNFLVPPKKLCTDNAAMIAAAAYFHRDKKIDLRKLRADANPVVKI